MTMSIFVNGVPGQAPYRNVLKDGAAIVMQLGGLDLPRTVWVNPAAGDTVTVEYREHLEAPWTAWPNGAVTAHSVDVIDSPVQALRFTRTAGSGTTSAYGIL